ncbi:sialate O-acetylesterase [Tichowtungia aerotolerans]|uniref:Sialate O-acetylesterase domain-containing protein n=1 Tax=Tichowtungia aerotolerans TaxID=2697043 RepID=A0A6P1M3W2_9BACT|nr:sialate O-acetylesterase [Tichowtungia aerotolerans]QHI68712.1 hypothetical protein GT409_04370 [Tichowtungia aerotolerans]
MRNKVIHAVMMAMLLGLSAGAELKLSAVFSDHMVLQAGAPVPVWGKSDPGTEVTVEFAGQRKSATVDVDGSWRVDLDPMPVSSIPRGLTASSDANDPAIHYSDLLVGEVWLCTGQSNMGVAVRKCINTAQDIAAADYPLIRFCNVVPDTAEEPKAELIRKPGWEVCTPDTAANFSAVGFYFGLHLYQELGVPVGLIQNCYGGATVVSYMDDETLEKTPARDVIQREDARYRAIQAERDRIFAESGVKKPGIMQRVSAHCYNAMIAPIISLRIRGVVWYQGETEALSGQQTVDAYRGWFEDYLSMMRRKFEDPNLPVYIVQLAGYGANDDRNLWAQFRQIQQDFLELPYTGIGTAYDVGEEKDLHPLNKKPVGTRLALSALNQTYGKEVVFRGPEVVSAVQKGSKVSVAFTNCPGGLVVKPAGAGNFTAVFVDGEVQDFPAETVSEGTMQFEVGDKKVERVRYAFKNTPEWALYNKTGLPALPFDLEVKIK